MTRLSLNELMDDESIPVNEESLELVKNTPFRCLALERATEMILLVT